MMDQSEEYAKMYDAAKEIHIRCDEYRYDFYMIKTATKFQYVPRQEHLQDMLGINNLEDLIYHDACIVDQYYDGLSIDGYYKSFASLEMSFLAMVMKCNYGRKWNSSEWVKA